MERCKLSSPEKKGTDFPSDGLSFQAEGHSERQQPGLPLDPCGQGWLTDLLHWTSSHHFHADKRSHLGCVIAVAKHQGTLSSTNAQAFHHSKQTAHAICLTHAVRTFFTGFPPRTEVAEYSKRLLCSYTTPQLVPYRT